MGKCLNFEEYTKNYKYIGLAIFVGLLNNSLSGINYYDVFKEIKIFKNDSQDEFKNHGLIHQIFNYFGTFIISFFILKIQQKKEINNHLKSKKVAGNLVPKISLIHYEAKQNYKVNIFSFLIIIFSLVFLDQVIEKYDCTLSHLDFWMIELIIISYLNSKLFKIQIYRHHKFVIFFNLFPIFFKIITIYYSFKYSFNYNDNKYKDGYDGTELKIIYVVFWYWIIIGLIIYIPLIVLKSYSYIKLKWFMDLKYISEYKLLMYYGFIGSIFYTIIVTIATFIKCKNDSELGPTDYICSIKKDETNETYYESFSIYFKTPADAKQIFYEILIVFSEMITFYIYKYYSTMIIKYLTPIHLIFSTPIYYFFEKSILAGYNFLSYLLFNDNDESQWDNNHKHKKYIFFLDISGDIFSIIGFLIYLEVIELSCFGLNINYRKNIIRRGTEESLKSLEDLNDSITDSENDENESRETFELIPSKDF